MSSLLAHIWQAGRNERLARQLYNNHEFKEWAVTVAFYSGLHYVEGSFATDPNILHSETSRPSTWNGSVHTWRENLIFNNYSNIYNAYRKLSSSSQVARYLSHSGQTPIGKPAEDYFSDTDINGFLNNDLDKIKTKLGYIEK